MGLIADMLQKAQNLLHAARQEREEAIAARVLALDDAVALATSFEPLNPGGASFRTHRLDLSQPGTLAFKPTAGSTAFFAVFALIGLLTVSIGLLVGAGSSTPDGYGATFGLLCLGGAFLLVGGALLRVNNRPAVIDVTRGTVQTTHDPTQARPLAGAHAIQIVRERVSGNKTSYNSYEINLVWTNGERVNLVDHGSLDDVRADAAALAQALGLRVWDASTW